MLRLAGASMVRDSVDQRVVEQVRSGEGGLIDDVSRSVAGRELSSGPARPDADGDGMPDDWETEQGLDPHNAADGNSIDGDGYTNLEEYLNGLISQ